MIRSVKTLFAVAIVAFLTRGAIAADVVAVATLAPSKAATTQPTDNHVTGTVTFTQTGDKVKVMAHIMGLAPNSEHAFHIHEKGDLSAADLTSAGGHFNPEGHQHGAPDAPQHHAGDFGNVKADAMGMAMFEITVDDISIGSGAKNDIVGKAVIVHGKPDDLKSQPAGNAGPRIAGGVIEVKK
ncbi:MAG TPA: superoxide dismutase family protein [Tepidisphaeraceae bacterium]|nr:superoxide dismutase family protein [Tepidisphaeraceae bacterium]